MFEVLNRALRYRDLAEECRHLAASGSSTEFRNRYLRMAEHYRALAEAEESSAVARQGKARFSGPSGDASVIGASPGLPILKRRQP
jgi:hypothetical protein